MVWLWTHGSRLPGPTDLLCLLFLPRPLEGSLSSGTILRATLLLLPTRESPF